MYLEWKKGTERTLIPNLKEREQQPLEKKKGLRDLFGGRWRGISETLRVSIVLKRGSRRRRGEKNSSPAHCNQGGGGKKESGSKKRYLRSGPPCWMVGGEGRPEGEIRRKG